MQGTKVHVGGWDGGGGSIVQSLMLGKRERKIMSTQRVQVQLHKGYKYNYTKCTSTSTQRVQVQLQAGRPWTFTLLCFSLEKTC